MADSEMKTTPWSIDRTINVPFLVTVLSGVIAGAVWASSMDTRLSSVESQMRAMPDLALTVARMDSRGEINAGRLERMERLLDEDRRRQSSGE